MGSELSLCIGISVKAVASESSPFIVVTDHFSDRIDVDASVNQGGYECFSGLMRASVGYIKLAAVARIKTYEMHVW